MAVAAGDLIFVGWDADSNDVAFLTTANITAAEVIYFTDREWNGSSFNGGEQLIEWTITDDIPAGTLLTLDMTRGSDATAEVVSGEEPGGPLEGTVDYISGFGNLASNNEMLWAFQGDRTGDDVTPTNFISVIGNSDAAGDNFRQSPELSGTGLTTENGAVIIDGDNDYMQFDPAAALGTVPGGLRTVVSKEAILEAVGDPSNWITADSAGSSPSDNPEGTDGGFSWIDGPGGTPVAPLPTAVDPADVTVLYFSGSNVAFFDAVDDANGGLSSEFSGITQPFLPTDIIEIAIKTEDIEPDGEFNGSEVEFTRVTVERDGIRYDLTVNEGSKIKESGATNTDPGQAKEQGDTFFSTNDEVGSFVGPTFFASPFSSFPAGKLVFANTATFTEGQVTEIDRFQGIGANANYNVSNNLVPPPPPCFVVGTQIDTPDGPRPIEEIKPGDWVLTYDGPPAQVRWAGRVKVRADANHAPVCIPAGLLGNRVEVRVSPQHRLLITGWQAELLFGQPEVLVPAKHVVRPGLAYRDKKTRFVDYVHLAFDAHEMLISENLISESYEVGPQGLRALSPEAQAELNRLFPDAINGMRPHLGTSKRPTLSAFEGRVLALKLMQDTTQSTAIN